MKKLLISTKGNEGVIVLTNDITLKDTPPDFEMALGESKGGTEEELHFYAERLADEHWPNEKHFQQATEKAFRETMEKFGYFGKVVSVLHLEPGYTVEKNKIGKN